MTSKFYQVEENALMVVDGEETRLIVENPGIGLVFMGNDSVELYNDRTSFTKATGVELSNVRTKTLPEKSQLYIRGVKMPATGEFYLPTPEYSSKYNLPLFRKNEVTDIHFVAGIYLLKEGEGKVTPKDTPKLDTLLDAAEGYEGPFKDMCKARDRAMVLRKEYKKRTRNT